MDWLALRGKHENNNYCKPIVEATEIDNKCTTKEKSVIVSCSSDLDKLNKFLKQEWIIDRITGPFGPWKGITNYTVWIKKTECKKANN